MLPYTAPELIRGLPSSQISVNPDPSFHTCANADVFSFAAIAFELLGNAYDAKASTSPPSSSSSSLSSPAAAATTAIRQLLPVRNNLNDYRVRLAWLLGQSSNPSPSPSPSLLSSSSSSRDPFQTLSTASSNSLSLAPPSSVSASNGNTSPLVIQMGAFGSFLLPLIQPLSSSYPARPSPSLIATHGLLMEDIRVRAIKFIEGLIQRDLTQKINFFNDLSGATKSQTIGGGGGGGMWQGIDERLLALRLAPAMIEELRSNGPEELQCALLPTLIAILAKLASYISPSSSSLPSSSSSSPSPSPSSHPLGPTVNELLSSFSRALADSIKGPTALALTVKHARSISSLFSSDTTASCLIPLVLKALEGPPQLQEDALGSLSVLGPSLEYSCLKNAMPRIHSLCLETTAAPIRCKCLLLLGQCSSRLDKDEADKILATISRVTGADRSLGTLRCSFKACEDVSNQWGAEVTAERILPLLSPLLLSPSLVVANDQPQPLNEVVSVVKGMVDRIHAKMMPKPGSSIGTGSGQAQGINSSNGLGSSGGVKKPAAPTAWDTYQAPVPSSSSSGLGGIVSGGGAGGWDFTSTSKPPPSQSMATASLSDAAVYSSSTQGQAAVKAPTISVVSASSVMSQLKPHASPATSSATATASTTTSQPHAPHPLPPNLVIPSASYPSRQVQPLNFPQPTSSPAVASRQLPDMFSNVDPSSSLNPHSLSATKMTMGVPGNGMSTRASEPPASANGYMFSGMNVAAAAQAPAPAANPTAIATKPVFDPFGTSKPLITNADNSLI